MSTPFNGASPLTTKTGSQCIRNVNGNSPVNGTAIENAPVTGKGSLTREQSELLLWLAQGNEFEVSEHRTTRERFITGIDSFTGRFNTRSIQRLKKLGYVTEHVTENYRVNWLCYAITPQGVKKASALGGS